MRERRGFQVPAVVACLALTMTASPRLVGATSPSAVGSPHSSPHYYLLSGNRVFLAAPDVRAGIISVLTQGAGRAFLDMVGLTLDGPDPVMLESDGILVSVRSVNGSTVGEPLVATGTLLATLKLAPIVRFGRLDFKDPILAATDDVYLTSADGSAIAVRLDALKARLRLAHANADLRTAMEDALARVFVGDFPNCSMSGARFEATGATVIFDFDPSPCRNGPGCTGRTDRIEH